MYQKKFRLFTYVITIKVCKCTMDETSDEATTTDETDRGSPATPDPDPRTDANGCLVADKMLFGARDLVHKCHSDPGWDKPGDNLVNSALNKTVLNKSEMHLDTAGNKCVGRPPRNRSSGATTGAATPRKCVLTLDGYSYVIVASPPDKRTRDDNTLRSTQNSCRNGQLAKQGSLTIVRRSSGRKSSKNSPTSPKSTSTEFMASTSAGTDDVLDKVDLTTENLPAVDTPDACDKAALRLRCLLRQLQRGEVSADLLQRNLQYAANVLEAVFIDETKSHTIRDEPIAESTPPADSDDSPTATKCTKRRLADEDDELSEVQPDAVPPEVREWLASTFTRQLATTRRKADEKPKFRSVAHAIRAGIFVDRIYRRVTSTAMMQFPPEVVKVLKTLDDWSFDVFGLSTSANGQPIKYLGYDLLNRYGMIHKFKVPPIILETFLCRIEEGYCKYRNPYHNNVHAADVAQTVHFMLCQTGLMNWLTDLEIFATLVAALIHDYEHTGTTNNYHVMTGSDTALLYNDRAVLENHHISAAFRVMKDDECNILQNLSRDEFREFRTLVIDMVLATDMSFHFQQLKNMKNLLSLAEPVVDKSKAVSLVLHCCDISHPAKKYELHHRWTMLLLEEFFRQGDMERDKGLPFSPLCDRNNTLVAESQIGFIEFIVEPSLSVCGDMLETILGPFQPITNTLNDSAGKERVPLAPLANKNGSKSKAQRPWTSCLAENKQIWKEQAAKDSEARNAAAAAAAATTEQSENNDKSEADVSKDAEDDTNKTNDKNDGKETDV